ncbi:MAG: virulence RhuM family protein [Candidatus Cloacimonadota bacterium]|nr:virulence RhuM family protein [Candidatus Cloacimonadota bacterium]
MENKSQLIIYKTEDGRTKLDVRLEDETVWLTQKLMAKLFQTTVPNINMHLKSIFDEDELEEKATIKDFLIVQKEGNREVKRKQKYYNLDAIISVGYRIKSQIATQFRIWATQRLKEYIVKGFTLNDERFKKGNSMNYFKELQERIREIRLSERFFYQKIKDIYTTSIDYDSKNENTIKFFKIVQNKLLWAISQQTAAELVYRRVDATFPLLGMQSYDKESNISVRKSDVVIAKNYLNEDEIKLLGLLVEQYLAFAETMAQQKTPMYMEDWIERLDVILQMNGRELLNNAGKISHQMAKERAEIEFNKYKDKLKEIKFEQNLKELVQDIKKLKPNPKKIKDKK